MRVLITGGTGFIGQHLTRAALRRGWQVTLLVRRPDSVVARKLADEGASIVLGSITDRLTLQAAFEIAEPEMFFHNAGWYELGIPRRARRRMWAVNVEGTENALTMAAEHSVSKVIYTSCTTALGDTEGELVDETFTRSTKPVSYYEHTKTEAHLLAVRHQTAGEPVVIACPAQAVGPGDHSPFGHFARQFVRGALPPVIWAPEGAFTYAHVEDVAEGLVLCGSQGQPREIYFLAGHVLTNRDLMRVWRDAVGRRPPFIWLPRSLAMAQARIVASLLGLFGRQAFMSPEMVRSSFLSFQYRSQKAVDQLGAVFRSASQAWEDTLREEVVRARVDRV